MTDKKSISEEEKNKAFIEKYNALCEEYKVRLNATPQFLMRDDGTFSVVVKMFLETVKE